MDKDQKIWWIISLGGFEETQAFYGSIQEADQFRIAKSEWHGMGGRKAKAKLDNSKHIELIEQKRTQIERGIGRGVYQEVPPPLEDRKKESLNRGFSQFKKVSSNTRSKIDIKDITMLNDGWFEILVIEESELVEKHLFSNFERASDYITLINLL